MLALQLLSCPLAGSGVRLILRSTKLEHWLDVHPGTSRIKLSHLVNSAEAPILELDASTIGLAMHVALGAGLLASSSGGVAPLVIHAAATGAVLLELGSFVAWDSTGTELELELDWRQDVGMLVTRVSGAAGAKQLSYPIMIDPLMTLANWTIFGEQAGERFGTTIALGDANGDGAADLAIGAPRWNDYDVIDTGLVYVVMKRPAANAFASEFDGRISPSRINNSVANTGQYARQRSSWGATIGWVDVDGNGRASLVVAGHRFGDSNKEVGRLFVLPDTMCAMCSSSCGDVTSSATIGLVANRIQGRFMYSATIPPNMGVTRYNESNAPLESWVAGFSSTVTNVNSVLVETVRQVGSAIPVSPSVSNCSWAVRASLAATFRQGRAFVRNVPLSYFASNFTTDIWYRGTTSGGGERWLFTVASSSDSRALAVRVNSGSIEVRLSGTTYSGCGNVNTGMWHHVAVSYRFGTLVCFLDGVRIRSFSTPVNQSFALYLSTSSFAMGVGMRVSSALRRDAQPNTGFSAALRSDTLQPRSVAEFADFRVFSGAMDSFSGSATVLANMGCDRPSFPLLYRQRFLNVYPDSNGNKVLSFAPDEVTNSSSLLMTISGYTLNRIHPSGVGSGSLFNVTTNTTLSILVTTTNRTCTASCGGSCPWNRIQNGPPIFDEYVRSNNLAGQGGSAYAIGDIFGDSRPEFIVGRPFEDSQPTGAMLLFQGGWQTNQYNTLFIRNPLNGSGGAFGKLEAEAYGHFGRTLLAEFDFTNDGKADIVVAAPRHTNVGANRLLYQGALYVYNMAPAWTNVFPPPIAWSYFGDQVNGGLGHALLGADVSCDGRVDLLVGMPYRQVGSLSNAGAVLVFIVGSNGLLPAVPSQIVTGNTELALFGYSLASLGNFDKTVCNDIAVGAPFYGATQTGAVFVLLTTAPGVLAPASSSQVLTGSTAGGLFGYALAGPFDYDGDGWVDLVVSSSKATNPAMANADTGSVSVFLGLPIADLSLWVVPAAVTVQLPSSFSLAVNMFNSGADPAVAASWNVTLSDVANVTLASALGACSAGVSVGRAGTSVVYRCTLASPLAPGSWANSTLVFNTQVDTPPSTLLSSGVCASTKFDPNGCVSPAVPAISLVSLVDLTLVPIIVNPASTLAVGSTLNVTLNITSTPGYVTAFAVLLSANLNSAGFQQLSVVPSRSDVLCFGALACSLPRLRSGEWFTVAIRLRVLSGVSVLLGANNTFAAVMTLSSASVDVNLADNVFARNFSVIATTDAVLSMVVTPNAIFAGAATNLVAGVSNVGLTASPVTLRVTVTPASATFASSFLGASGAVCAWDDVLNVLTCTLNVAVNANSLMSFIFNAPSSDVSVPLKFDAVLTTAVLDVDTANNVASLNVNLTFASDVGAALSMDSTVLRTEAPLTYAARILSGGPSDNSNVRSTFSVDVALPGLTVSAARPPAGTVCVQRGAAVVYDCITANVTALVDVVLLFDVTFAYAEPSSVIARFNITGSTITDTISSNNQASVTIVLAKTTSLFVSQTCAPDPVVVSSVLSCAANILAIGPNDATDVVLVYTLPANLVGVSFVPASGFSALGGNMYQLTVPVRINAGSFYATLVRGTATGSGLVTINAFVNSTTRPEDSSQMADNYVTTDVPIELNADVGVTLVGSTQFVFPASSLVYACDVFNAGPADVASFSLYVLISPMDGSLGTISAPGGVLCSVVVPLSNISTAVVSCLGSSLVSGASLTVGVEVNLAASALVGSSLSASANVSSAQPDAQLGNNYAATSPLVVLQRVADLAIARTAGSADGDLSADRVRIPIGDPVTVTALVYNNGPFNATSSSLVITFPGTDRMTIETIGGLANSASACSRSASVTETVISCQLGTIRSGRSLSLSFPITLLGETSYNATVLASVSTTTVDPQPINNFNSLALEILFIPDDGTTVAAPTKRSSGLSLFLALLIALLAAICCFCILAGLGFFKRKPPPKEGEEDDALDHALDKDDLVGDVALGDVALGEAASGDLANGGAASTTGAVVDPAAVAAAPAEGTAAPPDF